MNYTKEEVFTAIKYILINKFGFKVDGSWTDNRWYPDEDNTCPHCASIRRPSRNYPFSLINHCKTLKHMCAVNNMCQSNVSKIINYLNNTVFNAISYSTHKEYMLALRNSIVESDKLTYTLIEIGKVALKYMLLKDN